MSAQRLAAFSIAVQLSSAGSSSGRQVEWIGTPAGCYGVVPGHAESAEERHLRSVPEILIAPWPDHVSHR